MFTKIDLTLLEDTSWGRKLHFELGFSLCLASPQSLVRAVQLEAEQGTNL